MLVQAQKLAHEKPPRYDLAGSYLKQYLELQPLDPDALELKAEILSNTVTSAGHVQAALIVGDQVLRIDPKRTETRRRQIRLHLMMGAFAGPEAIRNQTAKLHAEGLMKEAHDAEAQRLAAARVYEGSGPAGQRTDPLQRLLPAQ